MLRLYFLIINCLLCQLCFGQLGAVRDSANTDVVQNTFLRKQPQDAQPPSLIIYPNPAKNKVFLQVTGFEAGIAQVKITDTRGKLWKQDSRLLISGQEEIAMFLSLTPGIYFISITEQSKVIRKKLVIL